MAWARLMAVVVLPVPPLPLAMQMYLLTKTPLFLLLLLLNIYDSLITKKHTSSFMTRIWPSFLDQQKLCFCVPKVSLSEHNNLALCFFVPTKAFAFECQKLVFLSTTYLAL
jgi:hypothetical protein